MDDDPVLRTLAAGLEHDDPRLAALLRAGPTRAARRVLAGVVGAALLVLAAIPLGLASFGVLGLCLLVTAPLVACWWCATADELRPPDAPPDAPPGPPAAR